MDSLETYFQCTNCHNIEKVSNWIKDKSNSYKCIKCEAVDKKDIWPPKEVEIILGLIISYDSRAAEYVPIASVFLASVLELLLEELLYTMAYFDLTYDEASILVDALIDAHRGKNQLISLYKKIGYEPFHSAVEDLGYSDFNRKWGELVKVRNKAVHGILAVDNTISQKTIETTIKDALEVFSKLRNKYNKESLNYKGAVRHKKGIDSDLEKREK